MGAATLSYAALDAVLRDHLGLGLSRSSTDRALGLYGAADLIDKAERLYVEMAYPHSDYLPERLIDT